MSLIPFLQNLIDSDLLDRYGSQMLSGVWVTARLVAISFSLGAVLGLLLAFARTSRLRVLRNASAAFIYVFRGSPLLAQLFLLYYGFGSLRDFWEPLGLWWLFRDSWYCALLAFTLNTAAYQAEIFRGSFAAVSAGQHEAAKALGLSQRTCFWRVVWPQSLLIALGPLGNELILLVKASAIASLVTVYDLMAVAKLGFSRTFSFQFYLWAAVLYLVLVEVLRRVLKRIDRRLGRHLNPL
ncbi:ABC transporter permease [Paraburkholderia silviterrae]|uniref:ABC transporter permease subunit n=1 Tax=Paraburkholderia silviterrae TaxID=2528715 RepID=A0A4R5M2X5_9BURK|nr:ABC transporter permease subunit [Paraburkholderia silviterrae]TDG19975.1 ABC transporter permease subunit [Paraburkholderia silviterrae]